MKSKIEEILYKHSERVGLYEGDVITCVNENDFDDVIEEIVKLFAMPGVSGRSEQLESGLTCMMCRKPKQSDGHTCCEECAGVAF